MPKSRKAKAKYKDFQKVKLKVGKKLPKADNVTNTSFKTRSINLKDQTKADVSGQPTTNRKQSLHNLLSHSQHYNVSMRHEAVTGLRELITDAPKVLHDNIATIVEHVAGLCLDTDAAIRHAVHRLFKIIMPLVSPRQITPFFPILNAHLCSAMTHIDDDLQLDSLKLVDLCLEYYPELVTAQSNLLSNFVDQISRLSNTSNGGPGGRGAASGTRSLMVNPSSRLSSQKWRIQVLDRLHRFLKAGLEQQLKQNSGTAGEEETLRMEVQGPVYHQVLGSGRLAASLNVHSQDNCKSLASKGLEVLSDENQLKKFVEVLVPLLLECWIEAGPSQLEVNLQGNVISADALETLEKVLSVLQLLFNSTELHAADSDIISMSWVREKYQKEFLHHFLPYFPYALHERPHAQGKKKSPKQPVKQVSVLMLNLTVCDVMSHFAVDYNDKESKTWIQRLTQFTKKLTTQSDLSMKHLQALLRFTGKILKLNIPKGDKEDLLCGLELYYAQTHALSQERQLLLTFLTELVLTDTDHVYSSMACIDRWLHSLPLSLVDISDQEHENVSRCFLHATRQLAPRGLTSFTESLQKNSSLLIDACGKFKSGALQLEMMELLYWVTPWSRDGFAHLSSLCHNCLLNPPALSCLLQGLYYRYAQNTGGRGQHVCSVADLLSLCISIILGKSQKDLDEICTAAAADEPRNTDGTLVSAVNCDVAENWYYSSSYTKVVCDFLSQFPNSHQVAAVMSPSIEKLVDQFQPLPLPAGYGVLSALLALHQSNVGMTVPLSIPMVTVAVAVTRDAAVLEMKQGQSTKGSESEVKRDVFELCGKVLKTLVGFPTRYVTTVLSKMEVCQTVDDLFVWVKVLGPVLYDVQLQGTVAALANYINTRTSKVECKLGELKGCQWWSDFKYQLLLIQPKHR